MSDDEDDVEILASSDKYTNYSSRKTHSRLSPARE